MNKKTIASVLMVALLAGAIAWAAPRVGSIVTVRTLNTVVMDEPSFLGTPVAKVYRGTHLTFLKKKGSWYRVRLSDGKEGWVHKSRVVDKMLNLSRKPGATKGASKDEVELARRGFNPSMEHKMSQDKNYNYSYVNKMEKLEVDIPTLRRFMLNGKIRFRAVVQK